MRAESQNSPELTPKGRDAIISALESYTAPLTVNPKIASAEGILNAALQRRDALLYLFTNYLDENPPARAERSEGITQASRNHLPTLLTHEHLVVDYFRAKPEIIQELQRRQDAGDIDVTTYNRLLGIGLDLDNEPLSEEEEEEITDFLAGVLSHDDTESAGPTPQTLDLRRALDASRPGGREDIAAVSQIFSSSDPRHAPTLRRCLDAILSPGPSIDATTRKNALQILGVFYWYTQLARTNQYDLTDIPPDILLVIEAMTDETQIKFQRTVIDHFAGSIQTSTQQRLQISEKQQRDNEPNVSAED